MNQPDKKFKTFANSPKTNHNDTFRDTSHRYSHDYENHPSKFNLPSPFPKKSKRDNETSGHQDKASRMKKSKCPTEISLMFSNASFLSSIFPTDLPMELLSLEVQVTQQILALREDKLTLLEEFNKALGAKFQAERELTRLKKRSEERGRESSETGAGGDMWLTEVQSSPQQSTLQADASPLIAKNKSLKVQYSKLLQQRKKDSVNSIEQDEEDNKLFQIQELQERSRMIQQELDKMEEKVEKINEQRFETFFPNDQKPLAKKGEEQKLVRLRKERNDLYQQIVENNPRAEGADILYELNEENIQLQRKADELLRKGSNFSSVQALRKRISEEEEAKKLFLQDLIKFKQNFEQLKRENLELSRQLFR